MSRIVLAAVMALGLAGAPPVRAAEQFLDPGAWAQALLQLQGPVTLQAFPAYAVTFRDSFGTWAPGEQDLPVDVGPQQGVGSIQTRHFAPVGAFEVPPGEWGGAFSCYQPVFPCLGINAATYVLPHDVIGIVGQLAYAKDTTAPFTQAGIDFFDNAAIDRAATDPRRYDGFFAILFDAPVHVLDLAWLAPLSDNFVGFRLSGAEVLVAAPEPSVLALLGPAVLGLGMVIRPGRRRGARPRPSRARPGRAIPGPRCPA